MMPALGASPSRQSRRRFYDGDRPGGNGREKSAPFPLSGPSIKEAGGRRRFQVAPQQAEGGGQGGAQVDRFYWVLRAREAPGCSGAGGHLGGASAPESIHAASFI